MSNRKKIFLITSGFEKNLAIDITLELIFMTVFKAFFVKN